MWYPQTTSGLPGSSSPPLSSTRSHHWTCSIPKSLKDSARNSLQRRKHLLRATNFEVRLVSGRSPVVREWLVVILGSQMDIVAEDTNGEETQSGHIGIALLSRKRNALSVYSDRICLMIR